MIYDVAVIGGGINGAGVARDLALRGARVILFEKVDFGWATTGASSRLIHGGARYILHDVGVTYKSSKDARVLTRIASHIMIRKPFLIPANGVMLELFDAYMSVYDIFSRMRGARRKCRITGKDVSALTGGLVKAEEGVLMEEYATDPLRLTALNIISAKEAGAKILNHTEVEKIDKDGDAFLVHTKDNLTSERKEYSAKVVVNVAGPWINIVAERGGQKVKIRPTKGIHVVFFGKPFDTILTFQAIDGRYLLFVPLEGYTLLGTTDDDFFGDRDSPPIYFDEVEYLVSSAETVIPSIRKFRPITTTVGIRSMLWKYGVPEDRITREHEIYDHDGFISVVGGKLASFRLLSEIISNLVSKKLGIKSPCKTHIEPLPGAEEFRGGAFEEYVQGIAKNINEKGVPAGISLRLARKYGSRASDILQKGREIICRCQGVLDCEIRYVIKEEFCRDLDDIMRRTGAGWGACQGLRCAKHMAKILMEELEADKRYIKSALERFIRGRIRALEPIRHLGTEPLIRRLKDFSGALPY